MKGAGSGRPTRARRPWIALAVAVTAFGLAAWAERQQEHSHLWTIDGDRFQLTSFLAPAHRHSREIPFSGIDRITGEADLEDPETTILVLHYGMVAFRMPSQSDQTIRRFDAYVERLGDLLTAAKAGKKTAMVLSLDPYLVVTVAAAAASLAAWIVLFVKILRSRPEKL
jgi:hypothetical protein